MSGPAVTVGLARQVDRATFIAQWLRVIRPILGAEGNRVLVEALEALTLPADGAASTTALTVHPADLFGNAADPPAEGLSVVVDVGPTLRIAAPDSDGDPRRETLTFVSPRAVTLVLDDVGEVGDATLLVTCGGTTCGALPVRITGGGPDPVPGPVTRLRVYLRDLGEPGRGVVAITVGGRAGLGAQTDVRTQALTLTLRDDVGTVVYQRTFPAGVLRGDASGRRSAYREPRTALAVRRGRGGTTLVAKLRATGLTLPEVGPPITATLRVGAASWQGSRTCVSPAVAIGR
jgi:hypothetical protein